jgi:acyl carrier protein
MDVRRSQAAQRSLRLHEAKSSLREWQVRAVVAAQLDRAVEDVKLDSALVQDLEADFLGITSVMLGIEEAFEIDIDPNDVATLSTVADVLRYVESALEPESVIRPAVTRPRAQL